MSLMQKLPDPSPTRPPVEEAVHDARALVPNGSTANIVAVGLLERRGLGEITFWQWFKVGILIAIPTLIIANILLLLQIPLMPEAPISAAAPLIGSH